MARESHGARRLVASGRAVHFQLDVSRARATPARLGARTFRAGGNRGEGPRRNGSAPCPSARQPAMVCAAPADGPRAGTLKGREIVMQIGAMNHPGEPLHREVAWMAEMKLDFVDLTL